MQDSRVPTFLPIFIFSFIQLLNLYRRENLKWDYFESRKFWEEVGNSMIEASGGDASIRSYYPQIVFLECDLDLTQVAYGTIVITCITELTSYEHINFNIYQYEGNGTTSKFTSFQKS
jgi:hypothetical protein